MATEVPTELPDLIDWLETQIAEGAGQTWQITLNSSGSVVEAKATRVQHRQTNERGHRMTISQVAEARFRLGDSRQRTVFRTE